jgi:hypothetical protein
VSVVLNHKVVCQVECRLMCVMCITCSQVCVYVLKSASKHNTLHMKPFIGNTFGHSGTVVHGRAATDLILRILSIVRLLNLLRIKRRRRYLDR